MKRKAKKKEGYSNLFLGTIVAIVVNVALCVVQENWLATFAWVCSAIYCWIAEANRQHAQDCFNWGQDCFEYGKKIQNELEQSIKN